MSNTIQLRHVSHSVPFRIEFFYDGFARSENGVVSIDSSKIQHIRAAFFRGYQITPEGRRLNNFADLDRYIAESIDGRRPTKETTKRQTTQAA